MTADAVGGVWTYALDLAADLAPLGVSTTLAVLGPGPEPDQAAAARAIPGLDLRLTGLDLDWTAADGRAVRQAADAVADLAADSGADLVQLNSPALAAEARFPAPVVGACHSCLASWWEAVRGGEPPEDFRWRVEMLARGYRRCDRLVAPTAAFAETTGRLYGVATPKVVHNGRRAPSWPTGAKRERFVLTAGRLWDDGKNIRALDAAAAQLDFPLFAAGPLRSPLGDEVRLQHAEPLGRLDPSTLGAWMDRAPVFASLARYEPFGLGALEAAQAGCALVLSDIPSFRELWDGAAIFTPADEPAAAARILERLLDDGRLSARFGASARRRARDFTAEAAAVRMAALYRELLGRPMEAAA